MNRMFELVTKKLNSVTGCEHHCYDDNCWASRMALRFKKVPRYKDGFKPHFNPEEFNKKFKPSDFVFVSDMGDLFGKWVPSTWIYQTLKFINSFPQTTFLLLTKNPSRYFEFSIPLNCITGATVETNRPNNFSYAPSPMSRLYAMEDLGGNMKKMLAIEPIMDFDLEEFVMAIKRVNPLFVYVGYDNWHCNLPEPCLAKTKELIQHLSNFTKVKTKSLREKK